MSESFYQKNKLLLYGMGALVIGGAFYFLSQDEKVKVYDPKVHTIEQLRRIIDEIFIECSTLYCQKLRLIREQKKDNEFKG